MRRRPSGRGLAASAAAAKTSRYSVTDRLTGRQIHCQLATHWRHAVSIGDLSAFVHHKVSTSTSSSAKFSLSVSIFYKKYFGYRKIDVLLFLGLA